MKKIMSFSLAGIAVLCLSVAPAMACDKSDAAKADASKASTQTASTGSGCCAKGANAKMVSAHGSCAGKMEGSSASVDKATCPAHGTMSAASIEECAKLMGMTPEECAKLCGGEGKMSMVSMNVKGMTCGGCEKTVTAALQKVDGVYKVVSVSHKDGTALVCVDAAKVKPEALATAVTNSGYAAEVVPAVATSTTGTDPHAQCTAAQKAACGAKAKEAKVETTGAEGTK